MRGARPLVAITRPAEQSRGLEGLLRERDFEVLLAPAIRRVPPESWAELDAGIGGLRAGRYDGLLFTSPAGVAAFVARWKVGRGVSAEVSAGARSGGHVSAEVSAGARSGGHVSAEVSAGARSGERHVSAEVSAGARSGAAELVAGVPALHGDVSAETSLGSDESLSRLWLAAVGPGTAAALRAAGLDPQVIAGKGTGADLANALIERLGADAGRMRFLLPRALEGREELARGLGAAGAQVDIVAAYRTLRATAHDLQPLIDRLDDLAAVVFASPSAVDAVLAATSGHLGGALAVAIGETTAGALRAAGVTKVAVASHPDDASMLAALLAGLG